MSVSLQEQISTLFSCLAMGLGVGLLYDLLRLVRLTLPRRTLQEILDLLFWLGACGMLFFCGIVFGNGRVRLYMALCLLLGATAYSAPGPGGRWTSWPGPPPGFWAG